MKTLHRSHPTWEELASFDLGQVSDNTWSSISEHVAGCDACCSLIDTIPQDGFVHDLRTRKEAGRHGGTISDVPAGLIGHPRYRVLEALGAGGTGAVFKAEHIVMGRLVAVKVIRSDLRDRRTAIDRLATEVKALARLSHPNLVAAFDAEYCGEDLYVIMEYVEGESLDRIICRSGGLPFELACDWISQAAQGLQYAFEHGLVHRDLKPANLVVTPQGQVKILDFGLARLIDQQNPPSAQTPDGSMVGTPAYTAPEQARDPKSADVRADLYSLGCTWYEMLTGQPPFPGATTLQQLLAHQEQSPRPVTQIRPDVPIEVDALFDHLLAKNPEDRFQSPKSFLEALQQPKHFLVQHSASRRAVRKRGPGATAILAIVVLLLLGVGLWQLARHLNSPGSLGSGGGKEDSSNPEKSPADAVKPAVDPLGRFQGVWIGDVATGFHVEMQIAMKNDKIDVTATYWNKKGLLAGSFVGANTAMRDGVLTFSQRFVKKPVSTWGDGKLHTLELVTDNVLKFRWKGGGTEIFTRLIK